MTVAVGCDLVSLDEVRESLARFGYRYLDRVFTAQEARYCTAGDTVARLAARFAAKEAVIKALRLVDEPTPLRQIEVVSVDGLPQLLLHDSMAHLAAERGWRETQVSLSHTDCHAMAVVVAVAGGDHGVIG